MRRWLALALAAVVLAAGVYLVLLRDSTVEPRLVASTPVAAIGSGAETVAVAPNGALLAWVAADDAAGLPAISLTTPPQRGRLRGPALEQVKVLAAAPAGLRPYVIAAGYDERGVVVELSTGIELIFGNAQQAARKWKAGAAALADPSLTVLDYVNLSAPSHPAVGGSGHTLPPAP